MEIGRHRTIVVIKETDRLHYVWILLGPRTWIQTSACQLYGRGVCLGIAMHVRQGGLLYMFSYWSTKVTYQLRFINCRNSGQEYCRSVKYIFHTIEVQKYISPVLFSFYCEKEWHNKSAYRLRCIGRLKCVVLAQLTFIG